MLYFWKWHDSRITNIMVVDESLMHHWSQFTRGDAPEEEHQRRYTRGYAPQVMQQRWCNSGDAPKVMHQRWCTRGDPPEVMHLRCLLTGWGWCLILICLVMSEACLVMSDVCLVMTEACLLVLHFVLCSPFLPFVPVFTLFRQIKKFKQQSPFIIKSYNWMVGCMTCILKFGS